MGVVDFEVQRERRVEMLREVESKCLTGNRRSGWGSRAFSKLAGVLAIIS